MVKRWGMCMHALFRPLLPNPSNDLAGYGHEGFYV